MDLEELAKECEISFTKTGGPGGQHRNKAETAVRVVHIPTGITVVAADSRSQHQNRMAALERLAAQLEQRRLEEAAAEKRRRRRRTKPSRRAVERRLKEKKERGYLKRLRRRVRRNDGG